MSVLHSRAVEVESRTVVEWGLVNVNDTFANSRTAGTEFQSLVFFCFLFFVFCFLSPEKNKNLRNVSSLKSSAVSCEIELRYLFHILTGSIICAYVIIAFKHLATKE